MVQLLLSRLKFLMGILMLIFTILTTHMIFMGQQLLIDLFKLGWEFWLFIQGMVRMLGHQQLRQSRWLFQLFILSIICMLWFDDFGTLRITMESIHWHMGQIMLYWILQWQLNNSWHFPWQLKYHCSRIELLIWLSFRGKLQFQLRFLRQSLWEQLKCGMILLVLLQFGVL